MLRAALFLGMLLCLLGCRSNDSDEARQATGDQPVDAAPILYDCDTLPVSYQVRSPYIAASIADQAPEGGAGAEVHAIPYTYIYFVPENLPNEPVPLVVAIHGLLGSAPQFAQQTQWRKLAEKQGFILALPTGPRKWDTTEGSFDAGFIRSIVAQIRSERCIDPNRIWATGHSYGGFMTQRLACDHSDIFAAGAVVSGGDIRFPVLGGPCGAGARKPGHEPMPLAFWHGTADQVVPYDMGYKSFSKWLAHYQCTIEPSSLPASYGAVETAGHCEALGVASRENMGPPFQLHFTTYDNHKHGYPDGCGGLGALSYSDCSPDASSWPTLEFHNNAILDFLESQVRSTAAADQAWAPIPSAPEFSDAAEAILWLEEFIASNRGS